MERYIMFLDRKNLYCQNAYTTQQTLQIQYNPYQTTNGIFHRTTTKILNLDGDTKDSKFSKQSWKRKTELEESNFQTSDYTRKLQSSRLYGTRTKTEIYIIGTK